MTVVVPELDGGPPVDRLGAVASGICAIHCAICALLPATFGALGLGVLLGHEAEWGFTLVAIAFAAGALILAWRRHRSRMVAALLLLGIVGLVASRCLETGAEHHSDQHAQGEHSEQNADDIAQAKIEHNAADHSEQQVSVSQLGGAGVGVLAGFLLFVGHLLNLRVAHRCRRECT